MLGKTISHYRVLDRLGAGGMGVVYRAEDTRLGRQVALKCLPPEFANDPRSIERFLREARSASALNHPNICTIHEVDEADGHHFITMELLDGRTLRERIAEGPIPIEEVVRIGIGVADALDAAHRKGIIHRDIKPANVFLNTRGEIKVLDFGLAKLEVNKAAGANSLTVEAADSLTTPGQVVGTIAYMSPEQARGLEVDARGDLFSLGIVLYEMATGRSPFGGATSALIFDAILNRTPAPPSSSDPALPRTFDNVVTKLLEKDCHLRYQSASDLVADMRRIRLDSDAGHLSFKTVAKPRKAGKVIDSLAVLPFTNATADSELDYLGDAIAERVIDELSQLSKLRVVPRSKAFRVRDHADDPQAAGRQLGVRAIVTGRIIKRGDLLSIRAELIDVQKDAQLWGAHFNRTSDNAPEVYTEISRTIREKLEGPSSGSKSSKGTAKLTAASITKEAYQLCLRAAHHANKWTQEGLSHGIELCRESIDIDPLYARPYAIMAISYAFLTVLGRVDTMHAYRQAKACAQKAIDLDESLSEAHAALAITHAFCDLDLRNSVVEGKRAFELNPSSGIARYALSQPLASAGHLEEAVEMTREGCDLDPLMTPINYSYGLLMYYQHRWDEAEVQIRRTLDIDPNFAVARAVRGIVLARAGRFAEAIAKVEEYLHNEPNSIWSPVLAYVNALAGERERALDLLARQDDGSPGAAFFAAAVYGALCELDKGFIELGVARERRFAILVTATVNPALDPFRSDPRWPVFLRSLNLGV
jgi:non-specific serine/threonine protein kinase